jgi:hypothetical protein
VIAVVTDPGIARTLLGALGLADEPPAFAPDAVDNSAKPGSGKTACEPLHRIDEQVVRDEVRTRASSSPAMRASCAIRRIRATGMRTPERTRARTRRICSCEAREAVVPSRVVRHAIVVSVLALCARWASAETRDELQARGEQFGRDGKWGEAIKAFKAAEQLEHRTVHACLIALAYTRREAWPQAELFLAKCHMPTPGETLPDWVADADELIRERLRTEPLSEVTIEVKPASALATLTVSSFQPDEMFVPRTIHLPHGTHLIVAHAPGYADHQRVVVIDSATPRHVVIDMLSVDRPIEVSGARGLRIAGLSAAGLGVISLGLGIKFGLDAKRDSDAVSMQRGSWTLADEATFNAGRAAQRDMYAAYIVGGALVVTGGVIYYLGVRAHVAPVVTAGSASVSWWARF